MNKFRLGDEIISKNSKMSARIISLDRYLQCYEIIYIGLTWMSGGHWIENEPYVFLLIGKVCIAKSILALEEKENVILKQIKNNPFSKEINSEVEKIKNKLKNKEITEYMYKKYSNHIFLIRDNKHEISCLIAIYGNILEHKQRIKSTNQSNHLLISRINDRIFSLKMSMSSSIVNSDWLHSNFKNSKYNYLIQ